MSLLKMMINTDFDAEPILLAIKQDILGFQITMNNALLVQNFHGRDYLLKKVPDLDCWVSHS